MSKMVGTDKQIKWAEEKMRYLDGIIVELKEVIEKIKEEPRAARMIHNRENDIVSVYNRSLRIKINEMEE